MLYFFFSEYREYMAFELIHVNVITADLLLLLVQEMQPPVTLTCNLKPYQKQALYWMSESEEGINAETAEKTLHPCWAGFHISDRYVIPSKCHCVHTYIL